MLRRMKSKMVLKAVDEYYSGVIPSFPHGKKELTDAYHWYLENNEPDTLKVEQLKILQKVLGQ